MKVYYYVIWKELNEFYTGKMLKCNQIKMNKNGAEEGVDKITNYQVWLR